MGQTFLHLHIIQESWENSKIESHWWSIFKFELSAATQSKQGHSTHRTILHLATYSLDPAL